MKIITLKQNGTFEHQWIKSIHGASIPASAIDVTDAVFMELSQNHAKKYEPATEIVSDYVPPFDVAASLNTKRGEIRAAFNTAAILPVTDEGGTAWSGGYDSALKLDAAKRMAEMAGLAQVSLFDAANVEHVLSLSDAEVVILTVGADYQAKFSHKQALMTAVDTLPNTAAQSDVDAIAVEF